MSGPERRLIRRPSIPPAVSLGSLFAHQRAAAYFDARRSSTLPPHALSPPFCLPGMRWIGLPVNVLRVLQDGPGGFSQGSSYLQPLCSLFPSSSRPAISPSSYLAIPPILGPFNVALCRILLSPKLLPRYLNRFKSPCQPLRPIHSKLSFPATALSSCRGKQTASYLASCLLVF